VIESPSGPKYRFPFRAGTRIAFGIGLLAFVLPFASVSCGGHEVFTARGVNTAIGGQYTFGGHVNYYSGDPYFLIAVLGAILALAGQFLRPYVRVRLIASAVVGLSSVVMMLIGQAHVNSRIASLQTNGAVTIRWEIAYWIALFAFGAGTVMAALESYRAVSVRSVPGSATPPSAARAAGGVIALVAALMIIAASAIPYIHYKNYSSDSSFDPSSSPSVFISGFGPTMWFAAEPIGVAILAFTAGVVLVEWMSRIPRAIAAGALLAFGVQTFLLFFGYVALAVGSPDAQLRPAGVVGMFAGILLFVAGLAPVLSRFARDSAPGEAKLG
jgi:hypothetical protein